MEASLIFSLKALGDASAVTAIISAFVVWQIAVTQLNLIYFHVAYVLTLMFLSAHLYISVLSGRNPLALVTAVTVMVCFMLVTVTSVPYPIIPSVDVMYELQNVNRILSTGVVQWGQGTGFARDYSYFPGTEIIVSVVSMISLLPQVALMKYGGAFVSVATVLFLYCVYRALQSADSSQQLVCGLAAAFAALSPRFVVFDAFMVHQTTALVFLGLVLLSFSHRGGREWIFLALLGIVEVSITHAFTSYVFIFMLLVLVATAFLFGKKTSAIMPNLTKIAATAAVVLVSAWSIFVALNYLPSISGYLAAITDQLISPKFTVAPVTPTGSKPIWISDLTYVGFATYFTLASGIIVRGILRRNARDRIAAWLALPGFLIFGALLAPYLAGLTAGIDLMARGLMYLYFFTAPFVAQFLGRRLTDIPHLRLPFRLPGRTVLTIGLIFVILAPSVYYGVPPSIYDQSSPILDRTDSRLSSGEWQIVAGFSREEISAHVVYGVDLAFSYVGGLGEKEVYRVSVPVGGTLFEWLQEHPGVFVFLRVSIIRIPDFGYVSANDLQTTLDHVNVLYSSGDVVIVEHL